MTRVSPLKKIAEVFDHNRITVHNLTTAQERAIKCWVDENCKTYLKTITKKCTQVIGVRTCKLIAASMLTDFHIR
ncbi:hypothetical protein HZS_2129 [Henneguya salminicola]|nr:hypothetical protein HZS_2129 [Henneguya salminicola]